MKNVVDYSKYKCPYEHLDKNCGHELCGPEGYENSYGVWCRCGFRGPVFYLDPGELNLEKKHSKEQTVQTDASRHDYHFHCRGCGHIMIFCRCTNSA